MVCRAVLESQDFATVRAGAGAIAIHLDGSDLGQERHSFQRLPDTVPMRMQRFDAATLATFSDSLSILGPTGEIVGEVLPGDGVAVAVEPLADLEPVFGRAGEHSYNSF